MEELNFLFKELFLGHMSLPAQTVLANIAITETCTLAQEADLFFMTTQRFAPDMLVPTHSHKPPGAGVSPGGRRTTADNRISPVLCYFHACFGVMAKKMPLPMQLIKQREMLGPALSSGCEHGHERTATVHQRLDVNSSVTPGPKGAF